MTPEEKLLALIQQEKKPAPVAMEQPKAVSPAGVSEPAVAEKPAVAVAPPVEAKKLKLATTASAASTPEVSQATPSAPAVQAPATAVPVEEASSIDKAEPVTVESSTSRTTPVPGQRRPVARPGRVNGIVLLNRALAGVALVLMVVVVYSVASIRADVVTEGRQLESGAGVQPVAPAGAMLSGELPAVDVFLDKVSGRNVFKPVIAGAATSTVAVVEGKAADLKLMGVSIDSSSDEESTAFIRNKAESKTYFVKKGQMVGETGYTLERVYNDHVILKMRKQEIELK